MKSWIPVALGLLVAAAVGCSQKEEPAQTPSEPKPIAGGQQQMPADHPPMEAQQGHGDSMMGGPAGPREVMVPEEVATEWDAVVLQVTNKTEGTAEDVTVPIGETVNVEDLTITVQNFVPHFSMGGGTITSASNETANPAAQLVVKQGETELFSGWLFSMYPDAHPMEHETYGVILKDFVKAEQAEEAAQSE